jgi:hypothetical protein
MNARTDWWGLARESVTSPRTAARAVLALRLPAAVLWQLMVLVSILTVLLIFAEITAGGGPTSFLDVLSTDPIVMAGLQFLSLLVMAAALYGVGRAFGGTGDWAGAMALVIWLQAIMLGVAAFQTVLYLLLPPLAQLVGLASVVLLLWLLTNFTAELHGFTNLWAVFFGILGAGALLIVTLSYLLYPILTSIPGGA